MPRSAHEIMRSRDGSRTEDGSARKGALGMAILRLVQNRWRCDSLHQNQITRRSTVQHSAEIKDVIACGQLTPQETHCASPSLMIFPFRPKRHHFALVPIAFQASSHESANQSTSQLHIRAHKADG